MRCLPTCAQGSSAAITRIVGDGFLGSILGAPWSLVHVRGAGVAVFYPSYPQDSDDEDVPSLDTPFGRRSVGALSS